MHPYIALALVLSKKNLKIQCLLVPLHFIEVPRYSEVPMFSTIVQNQTSTPGLPNYPYQNYPRHKSLHKTWRENGVGFYHSPIIFHYSCEQRYVNDSICIYMYKYIYIRIYIYIIYIIKYYVYSLDQVGRNHPSQKVKKKGLKKLNNNWPTSGGGPVVVERGQRVRNCPNHLRSHAKDNESPDLCWTSVTSASSSPDAARSMGDMAAVELCGVGYASSLALGRDKFNNIGKVANSTTSSPRWPAWLRVCPSLLHVELSTLGCKKGAMIIICYKLL